MNLLLPALVGGVTAGALYGLLSFSVVVLYKATGVANFAVAILGTLDAFVVWKLILMGVPMPVALVGGVAFASLVGALTFAVVINPRPSASPSNVIVRTLALALVLTALVDHFWAVGQPFAFPRMLPAGAWRVAGVDVPWATVVTLFIAAALVAVFALVFNRTDLGLELRAVATNVDIARLLGIRYRRIAMIVWATSGVLSMTVAVLSANRLLLSTSMLDGALLYAFAGAITFGLTSLPGALLGGLAAGVFNSVVSTYTSSEVALLVIFGALVLTMFVKPNGVLGAGQAHRV